MINGLILTTMRIIDVTGGSVLRVMNTHEESCVGFGEAYFSKIKFGKIKAWKFHTKMILNLIVPVGKVKFVFYSQKNKHFKVIEIGEKRYSRLTIPAKIWFGFKGVGKPESIILSISNLKHSKKEIFRCKKNKIKFNW